jgi:hypothetical protein
MATTELPMTDNPAIRGKEERYLTVRVDSARILKSWRQSLFSFEWLTPDGDIRATDDLPMREHEKRLEVEKALKAGQALERPVLGIGLMDNVEIGSGRAVFLTLSALGHKVIEVHIPVSNKADFKLFLS